MVPSHGGDGGQYRPPSQVLNLVTIERGWLWGAQCNSSGAFPSCGPTSIIECCFKHVVDEVTEISVILCQTHTVIFLGEWVLNYLELALVLSGKTSENHVVG